MTLLKAAKLTIEDMHGEGYICGDLRDAIEETERRQKECDEKGHWVIGGDLSKPFRFCPDCGADLREVKPCRRKQVSP